MIQIKMGARQPPKEFALGWTLLGWATALTNRHRLWSTSTMKRCLAAFAIAASLFAPVAHANDALEAKVRAYVPVVSLVKVCDIRINEAASGDHRAMLIHGVPLQEVALALGITPAEAEGLLASARRRVRAADKAAP